MNFFERIHENMPLFADSLNETGSRPVSGIVHRHPDRTPFTVTQCCTAYCRYCTRFHFIGKLGQLSKGIWTEPSPTWKPTGKSGTLSSAAATRSPFRTTS